LLGVGSFARNLQRLFIADDGYGVTTAAGNVLDALTNIQSLARTGHPYMAPDELWNYEDTLTILAPLRRDAAASVVWRASIYSAEAPLTAVWSPVPTQTVTIGSAFASTRDGAWDDFVSQWYSGPLTPTVGLWCSYVPPVQLTSEVTETLALSVSVISDVVQLSWSATSNETATDYWLLARSADLNWVVIETFPLTQTTYAVLPPADGETYQFRVEARNEESIIVAHSATVQQKTPDTDLEKRIYLPVVER
jgi:hypothetical protein